MDKATPTPSPASADSVMAKAMMLVGALDDSCEEATSLPFLEAVTALRAEVERLAQSAPTGLTDMGWVIDAATKGELAAYDQGIAESIQAVTKILDGKDAGAGIANRPWEPLRRRLLALVAQSAPLAQQAAREYPPLPPTLKCKPNEYCLAQHHVSLFTANQMRAYVDADRAAAQVEPGETLNVPVQPMKAENPPPA